MDPARPAAVAKQAPAPGQAAAADSPLPASVQRVQAVLDALAPGSRVVLLPDSARTAQQAADALGVQLGQIAKSLVFRAAGSGRAVLAVVAGDRRASEAHLAALLGEPIERADPAFVRASTGYAIGGVPPIAHAVAPVVFADASLARFDCVWAAGGTPHAVFGIAPAKLFEALGVRPADIT